MHDSEEPLMNLPPRHCKKNPFYPLPMVGHTKIHSFFTKLLKEL